MASSSSSTRAAAAAAGRTTYQVFLSFRGPDTRQGFTDVLYHALVDAGVRVFRDDEEIRKGEKIDGEILTAIEESKIFVPIFSKGYASSKWCLIEFTKMVELENGSSGQKIIPIFYDVRVDDVKLKTELYTEALKKQKEKCTAEAVEKWEEALRQAGTFKGWELKHQGHAEFAKLVVRDILVKLEAKHRPMTEYFVERDDQVKALIELLDIESSDARFVGIYGMGGIGKTTLAQVVFNKLCDRFDGRCSFLANVRESSKQHKGIESLQKQLLRDLVRESEDITDVHDGMKRLREKLARKNALIVLDDVDSKEQIDNLVGVASSFGPGSRIIITSRDKSLLEIQRLGIQTLEVEELKAEEASRLFCMHAFQKDSPPDDYLSLSEEAVGSAGRLPLALAVIGSLLADKPRKRWDDTIERLKKVPHEDVQKKLMISYETLSHETKQIFLDIACFFIGQEKAYPIYLWQACDFNPKMRLKELVNLSLVKITVDEDGYTRGAKKKKLWMHDQLRDLGRNIAKPCRIWMPNDAREMLLEEEIKGKENVEMIRLRCHDDNATFTKRDLSRFGKLRYFECYSGDDASWMSMMVSNKLRGLSLHKHPRLLPNLRWLSWHGFPPKFMGVELCLRKLVILNLSESSIDENWRGWKQFVRGSPLKVLDLSGCSRLKRTPDLSVFSSLERLILRECSSLVEIDPSIEQLAKLEVLSLEWCSSLEKLPVSIGNLENLRVIYMGCTGIRKLPDSFGMLKRLEELDTFETHLEEIPSTTIEGLTCLRVLKLDKTFYRELPTKLPTSLIHLEIKSSEILTRVPEFSNLQNLVRLVLDDSPTHKSVFWRVEPMKLEGIGKLRRLVELGLDLWNLTCIPEEEGEELSSLPQLQMLRLGCPNLQHCPPLPSTLSHLTVTGRGKTTSLPPLSHLKNLSTLTLDRCCVSDDIVRNLGFEELESLTSLSLKVCEIGNLLHHLPSNLQKLNIGHCSSVDEAPPGLSRLKNLKELQIWGADDLVEIPELGELESLQKLHIASCGSLRGLQNLSKLKMLRSIYISLCRKFKGIDGVGELDSSVSLHISDCDCPDVPTSTKRPFGDLNGEDWILQLLSSQCKLALAGRAFSDRRNSGRRGTECAAE